MCIKKRNMGNFEVILDMESVCKNNIHKYRHVNSDEEGYLAGMDPTRDFPNISHPQNSPEMSFLTSPKPSRNNPFSILGAK